MWGFFVVYGRRVIIYRLHSPNANNNYYLHFKKYFFCRLYLCLHLGIQLNQLTFILNLVSKLALTSVAQLQKTEYFKIDLQ